MLRTPMPCLAPILALSATLLAGSPALRTEAPALPAGAIVPPAGPPAEGTTYTVDPVHSSVIFGVRHLGVSNFYGVFEEVTGTVVVDEEDLSRSRVSLEIPTDSLETRDEKRNGHLRSPDFFNTREFPSITFESSAVRSLAGDRFEVEGDLEVRGQTSTMTIEVEKVGEGKTAFGDTRAGFEARFTVNLETLRMPVLEKMSEAMLGREVRMIVSLECIRS